MGLIDFVKNAGRKMLGKKSDEEVASALMEAVQAIKLEIEELQINFEKGIATVFGRTTSRSEAEKVVLTVGNHDGVEGVDDQIEVAAQVEEAEPEAQYYTVQKGDSLSKIAKEYYGDAMKYPVIFEANKPMLEDPDLIYPGQVLRIPPV